MNDVALPSALLGAMKTHARETYPEECCGFLIGGTPNARADSARVITALERARNQFPGQRRRRSLITSDELRDVDRRLATFGTTVVGFYHSHPDQRAQPSRFDRDHAWPGPVSIVLSVTPTEVPDARAFELDPESRRFREVRLRIEPGSTTASAVVEG